MNSKSTRAVSAEDAETTLVELLQRVHQKGGDAFILDLRQYIYAKADALRPNPNPKLVDVALPVALSHTQARLAKYAIAIAQNELGTVLGWFYQYTKRSLQSHLAKSFQDLLLPVASVPAGDPSLLPRPVGGLPPAFEDPAATIMALFGTLMDGEEQ